MPSSFLRSRPVARPRSAVPAAARGGCARLRHRADRRCARRSRRSAIRRPLRSSRSVSPVSSRSRAVDRGALLVLERERGAHLRQRDPALARSSAPKWLDHRSIARGRPRRTMSSTRLSALAAGRPPATRRSTRSFVGVRDGGMLRASAAPPSLPSSSLQRREVALPVVERAVGAADLEGRLRVAPGRGVASGHRSVALRLATSRPAYLGQELLHQPALGGAFISDRTSLPAASSARSATWARSSAIARSFSAVISSRARCRSPSRPRRAPRPGSRRASPRRSWSRARSSPAPPCAPRPRPPRARRGPARGREPPPPHPPAPC